MAHLIEQMAYVGQTPWHGLGNQLTTNQPLEVWSKQVGLDWQIQESPVCCVTNASGNLGENSVLTASVAPVGQQMLRHLAGVQKHPFERSIERVAIVRIAGQGLTIHHKALFRQQLSTHTGHSAA
jgi:hypothetical protein